MFIQSGFSLRSEPTHCGPSCWQWMCFTESAAWTPHELLLSTVFIQLKWNLSRSKKPLIKMWLKLFDRLNLSGSLVVLVFSWVCSLVHLLSWINDKSFWSDQTPSALSYYSLCFWFMLCLYFCLVRFSSPSPIVPFSLLSANQLQPVGQSAAACLPVFSLLLLPVICDF